MKIELITGNAIEIETRFAGTFLVRDADEHGFAISQSVKQRDKSPNYAAPIEVTGRHLKERSSLGSWGEIYIKGK